MFNDITSNVNKSPCGLRLSLYDTSWTFVSKRSLRPSCQRTQCRLQRLIASNLGVCADHSDVHRDVVGLGGLEPPASPLSGVRSNHLSYRPNAFPLARDSHGLPDGGACRDRTDDPLLAKQVLSQLS